MEVSAKSSLDLKAVVKIRLYLRGNLGLKGGGGGFAGSWKPSVGFLPLRLSLSLFWLLLVRERVQVAQLTPETLHSPRSFFKDLQGLPR